MAQTVNNNILARQARPQFQSFIKTEKVLNNISATLGSETKGKKFVSSLISAVSTNQALQECESTSIISGALLGEALNLSPSPQLGHFYLVPYKDNNKNVTVATFQLGYKGMVQLAIRSGQYKKINVLSLKEGELVSFNALTEEIEVNLIENEEEREKAKTTGYYAMFELVNGFKKTMYWSVEKMKSHAMTYSKGYANDVKKGYSYTFWSKDFDGMAYKTMLRQLISKWGIMSIELQNAYINDMSYQDETGKNVYIDNDNDVDFFEVIPTEIESEPKQPQSTVNKVTGEVKQEQPSLI